MYTNGIRKIFTSCNGGLAEVKARATTAGFEALSFNGIIFIRDEDSDKDIARDKRVMCPWVKTCLRITDFTDIGDG